VELWRCGGVEVGWTRDGHRRVRNPGTLFLDCFCRTLTSIAQTWRRLYQSHVLALIPDKRVWDSLDAGVRAN
jgi:hypothetical protein